MTQGSVLQKALPTVRYGVRKRTAYGPWSSVGFQCGEALEAGKACCSFGSWRLFFCYLCRTPSKFFVRLLSSVISYFILLIFSFLRSDETNFLATCCGIFIWIHWSYWIDYGKRINRKRCINRLFAVCAVQGI